MGLFQKIFGTHSENELKRINPIVDKIESLQGQMSAVTDEELKGKTVEFKERLVKGETLDDILPEAFAVVREASTRVLGMTHYRVQLIGGVVLHQGRIAEMRTGEGKTLVSTSPAYLNALAGEGVHIVTVNEYLASRDAEEMGQVHRFLGLTVGVVTNGLSKEERQAAYGCDITYITNNELGFDYLRNNMVSQKRDLTQRSLNFAIIDEVDSVLIDEARTPLIISGQGNKSTQLYQVCNQFAATLERGEGDGELSKMDVLMKEVAEETGDFIVNEKDKNISLTAQGVARVEKYFNIDNLADSNHMELQHNIILALRAHNLMFKDQDYVVKDGEIIIVDEFTGRLMPGRRYSDGLHQAIEAKEKVQVKRESRTLANVTFQNLFNKYTKKCGMTGTAITEEQEFRDIYGMDVVEIPTNRPIQRIDLDDGVYKTRLEKFKAAVEEVKVAHEKGQPVLVGTITIEVSELLSTMLKKQGVPHKVLNAKFHEQEAEIVSEAGKFGAVTIATNMAGRGTDIKLDERAVELGGLKIIGTERHESRRIDNQLRGRAGRQGDVGESKFYISLEDDLMRLFGSDRLMMVFDTLGVEEGQEIEHKMLSNAVEKAQKKIESNNFGIRKNLLEYDQVMNEQREIMYEERRRVLDGESMQDSICHMYIDFVDETVDAYITSDIDNEEWDLAGLNATLKAKVADLNITKEEAQGLDVSDLKEQLRDKVTAIYKAKEKEIQASASQADMMREIERTILLKVIDQKWMQHIDDMERLRQGIGLQAYAQKNPLVEYKMQGYDMFEQMTQSIKEDTVRILSNIRIEQKIERAPAPQITGTNRDESTTKAPKKRVDEKMYPNSPCSCGSGKKHKQCCGKF